MVKYKDNSSIYMSVTHRPPPILCGFFFLCEIKTLKLYHLVPLHIPIKKLEKSCKYFCVRSEWPL